MMGFLFRSKLLNDVEGAIWSGYMEGVTNKPKFGEAFMMGVTSASSRKYIYEPSKVINAAQQSAQRALDAYNSGNYTEHEKKVANIVLSHFFDKHYNSSLAEDIVRSFVNLSNGSRKNHRELIKRIYDGVINYFYI